MLRRLPILCQSSHYKSKIKEYPLLKSPKILEEALYNYHKGILRYNLVTSGRALNDKEIKLACQSYQSIKKAVQFIFVPPTVFSITSN